MAILYLIGLLLVPLITLAFTHQTVPLGDLVVQTILLIGLPMLASRPLRRFPRVVAVRTSAVSVSFFFLVIAIAGSTRGPLLQRPELLVSLGRPSSRERGVDGLPNRRVIVGIAEHVAPVDDDGEAASHAMPEAEPNSARGLEADDLNPKARAELPDEAFGELVRPFRVLA